MKTFHIGIGLLLALLLLGAGYAVATMNNLQGTDMTAVEDSTEYSVEPLLALIRKYTVDGGESVDYAAWKDSPQDVATLDRQVAMITSVSPHNHPELFPSTTAQRSYWINTYNTLVLQAVLENWPMESVRDVKISLSSRVVPGKGFFYDRKIMVGGKETNLYKLEKEVLLSQKDSRLHFALNCASESCPLLRPWEWSDEQLDVAARDFINDASNVSIDDDTVNLSRIFKWYKKDFPTDIYAYLQQYAEPPLRQRLQIAKDKKYRIRYPDYDWSVNDNAH
jgi:hypothetical protein